MVKQQKEWEQKAVKVGSTVSSTASIFGSYQLCHSICMTLVSFLTILGITVAGMPLVFLQKISLPLWSIAVVLLGASLAMKAKYKGISSNLLVLNMGLIVIGTPFKAAQPYAPLFWIVGGTVAAFAVVQMLLPKLSYLTEAIRSWRQRDLVPVALIGGSILVLLIAALLQFNGTGHLTTGKDNLMDPAQKSRMSSMSKFTAFDIGLAKQLMDKNNDGMCDVCGMPVEQCISSGQLECTMGGKNTIGVLGSQHIHQDIAIFVDDRQLDLNKPEYWVKSSFIHVEQDPQGGIGLHIHASGVPLQLFVDSIGLGNRQWSVFVNGQQKDISYVPANLDKILITTSQDPAHVQKEIQTITNSANNY